jgi:hypothetical protein
MRLEFEPTIPEFERAKTVHTLDRAATVIGNSELTSEKDESLRLLVGFLGWGIAHSKTSKYTIKNKHRKYAVTHPCLKWNSNSRRSRPSVRAVEDIPCLKP